MAPFPVHFFHYSINPWPQGVEKISPGLFRCGGICYNSFISRAKGGGDGMSADERLLELLEQDPEAGLAALM